MLATQAWLREHHAPRALLALTIAGLRPVSELRSLGYNDLGFRNNHEIDTPNLDALALGGIILDRYCTDVIICILLYADIA